MTPALELTAIGRTFGGVRAVDDVDMTIVEGARHVVFGPNGAGKTTLFKIISGELAPSSGSIRMFGLDVSHHPPWRRTRHGLARTFQITTLFPDLTVRQHLALAFQARSARRFAIGRDVRNIASIQDAVHHALTTDGLSDIADLPVATLSYGEQRLIEISVALACRPRLLLLDEPTAGLAGEDVQRVMRRISSLPTDVTLLLIEHNLELAFGLSRTATVLAEGSVIAHGIVDEIRQDTVVQQTYLGRMDNTLTAPQDQTR